MHDGVRRIHTYAIHIFKWIALHEPAEGGVGVPVSVARAGVDVGVALHAAGHYGVSLTILTSFLPPVPYSAPIQGHHSLTLRALPRPASGITQAARCRVGREKPMGRLGLREVQDGVLSRY